MNSNLTFHSENSNIPEGRMQEQAERLQPIIEEMRETLQKNNYEDQYASIKLADDHEYHERIMQLAHTKGRGVETLIICGIGGSNLGTKAMIEAVLGEMHNHIPDIPKVYFADTTDAAKIKDILNVTEKHIHNGDDILLNIVTKSGTTTETIANAETFMNLLEEHGRSIQDNVVITTQYDSPLWNLAEEMNIDKLGIPEKVGGRYSVFSAVGLFPLAILGLDIKDMMKGVRDMRDICLQDFHQNPAAQSAAALYYHNHNHRNIHDTFIFSTGLETVGKWYRQLMAESLGKQGKGMTPNVSIGSTDLHSMAQLYLGGPEDKFTTFITIQNDKARVKVPQFDEKFQQLTQVEGKSYEEIRNAIFEGTKKAYENKDKPHWHIELLDRGEYTTAQLLQFKMMEIIYFGKLLEVNPFNQPNVEEYKEETRKLLNPDN